MASTLPRIPTGSPSAVPKRRRTSASKYAQQPTVTVLVGESKQAFFIHKELLRNASPYFSTRLKACWDGEKPCIDLPEVSPEVFGVIAEFIYFRQIPEHLIQPGYTKGPLWERLFPIYKAADALMMVDLQNEIVDVDLADALRNGGGCWSLRSVAAAFEHEITHTPYYQLVLNYAVRRTMSSPVSDDDMERHLDTLSFWPQGMRDVLKMINVYNREPWGRLYDGDWCRYHIHVDGEDCKQNFASSRLPGSPSRSRFGRRM